MPEMNNQTLPDQDKRPTLRCPACHFMVPLPAEICSKCGANLRTGFVPVSEEEETRYRRGRFILGGAVLFLVAAVAAVFFFVLPPRPPVVSAPSLIVPGSELGDALEAFQDLQNQPLGAQPAIILNRSKQAAGQMEEHWEQVDEIYQEK